MKLLLFSTLVPATLSVCTPEQYKGIDPCADGVEPTRVEGGCPSCKKREALPADCDRSACDAPSTCVGDTLPERISGTCCVTCKLPQCDEAARAACLNSADTLPVCATIEDFKFDVSTCCYPCKRGEREGDVGTCTRQDFEKCTAAAPVCVGDEVPLRDGNCCGTCKRPEAGAGLLDVARCADLDVCEAGETPSRVEGVDGAFACPTCRPPRPVCATECGETGVCVRSRGGPVCRSSAVVRLRIKARKVARRAALTGATPEKIDEVLKEICERFCDQATNEEICAKKDEFLSGLKSRIRERLSDEIVVDVDVPAQTSSTRRLLSDSPQDLLSSAVTAATEDSDLEMTVDGQPSSAASAVPFMALAFASILALVF